MAENEKTNKKTSQYNQYKDERDAAWAENAVLTQKVKDLWAQSEAKGKDAQMYSKEAEALKLKLEALNEAARNNLAKKNLESERLQKLESENDSLKKEVGAISAKCEAANDRVVQICAIEIELSKQNTELEKFSADLKNENVFLIKELEILGAANGNLKSIYNELLLTNEDLKDTILALTKKVHEFNEFKAVQDKAAIVNENILNSLKLDFAKLKKENEMYKNEIGLKKGKMYVFMVVVSVLAVFANLTHVGAKYLSLIDSPTVLNWIVCYGSMLVFDLAIFLFTISGKKDAAMSFASGVFLIVFMQLGSPFQHAEISTFYFERIIAGLIYSAMFAFIPYKLSQLFTEK